MRAKVTALDDAMGRIDDGDRVLVGGSLLRRQPMAAVHELLRQGRQDLEVTAWAGSLAVDMLAAQPGVMPTLRAIYCGLMQFGLAPNFRAAAESGALRVLDLSESSMTGILRGAAAGKTFVPLRGLRGTDQVQDRPDIATVTCPFTYEQQLAFQVPTFDWAIVHGHRADRFGNILAPRVRDTDDVDRIMAQAAGRCIVTVEEIVDAEVVADDPVNVTIPHYLVDAVVEVPRGAYPSSCDAVYDHDDSFFRWYVEVAKCGGTPAYITEVLAGFEGHAAFVKWVDRKGWKDA